MSYVSFKSMTTGGDIDRNAIAEAFSRIKGDIAQLSNEIYNLKLEQKKLLEEKSIDTNLIKQIVKETLNAKNTNYVMRKFNKKRKQVVITRIQNLASQKNLSLSDIKDIIVETEQLCSKATFYRYIELMKKRNLIDIAMINETEILVVI